MTSLEEKAIAYVRVRIEFDTVDCAWMLDPTNGDLALKSTRLEEKAEDAYLALQAEVNAVTTLAALEGVGEGDYRP